MKKIVKEEVKALVVEQKGELWTDSLTISEQFGRPHFRVLKSIGGLQYRGSITTGVVVNSWTDARGRAQELLLLNERAALIAMPFIGGKKAEQGQVILVDAFLAMRAELSRLRTMRDTPEWQQARLEGKQNYSQTRSVGFFTKRLPWVMTQASFN